jgi:hypothetical protein
VRLLHHQLLLRRLQPQRLLLLQALLPNAQPHLGLLALRQTWVQLLLCPLCHKH